MSTLSSASFTVVLINPQIPPNTGNIARLCAATKSRLHIVGDIGFDLSEKALRRAGLDYWQYLDWDYFPDLDSYIKGLDPIKCHVLTTKTDTPYWSRTYSDGDYLIFGSEVDGIPKQYMDMLSASLCTIPMSGKEKGTRCLNLSTSAGIALYEAIRQQQ